METLTAKEISKRFNIDPISLKRLCERHGVKPCLEQARGSVVWRWYRLDEIEAIIPEHRGRDTKGKPKPRKANGGTNGNAERRPVGTVAQEQAEWTHERKIKQRLDNAERLGKLLRASDVLEVVRGVSAIFASELDQLPSQICDLFPGHTAENRQRLLKECRRIRSRTADKLEAYASEIAAKQTDKPVLE